MIPPPITTMVASLGALTSLFTPPATCSVSMAVHALIDTENVRHFVWGPDPDYSPECYPPWFDPDPGAFYSPGLCPSGMTSAWSVDTMVDGTKAQRTLCCPTAQISSYRFVGVMDPNPQFLCRCVIPHQAVTVTFTDIGRDSARTETYATPTIHAYGIAVVNELPASTEPATQEGAPDASDPTDGPISPTPWDSDVEQTPSEASPDSTITPVTQTSEPVPFTSNASRDDSSEQTTAQSSNNGGSGSDNRTIIIAVVVPVSLIILAAIFFCRRKKHFIHHHHEYGIFSNWFSYNGGTKHK